MLTSIDIARVCHEANREYCFVLGDYSQRVWDDATLSQQQSAITGVEKIRAGEVRSPQDSHVSWFNEKMRAGWAYGPMKDEQHKLHPCLVPFDQLPLEQQAKDHLFFAIASSLLKIFYLET